MSRLRPAKDWILLELIDTTYKGMLVIPDQAKDASMIGSVIAVGPGKYDIDQGAPGTEFCYIPLITKVGDKVLFPKYSGSDVEWEGEKYLLLPESEVICYVEED